MLVLPEEPVTPTTTSPGSRSTTARASRPSAACGSSTTTAGAPVSRPARAATAPTSAAATAKSWPSTRSPGRATNRSPGATARESIDDAAGHGCCRVRSAGKPASGRRRDLGEGQRDHARLPWAAPPGALARCVARWASTSRTTARSSNGWTTPATSWPCSWPLPATRTTPPPQARSTAVGDRSPAPLHLDDLHGVRGEVGRRSARAAEEGCPDRRRVLRARVVVGDDDDVGRPGRRLAHPGPLVAVPVATGTEDDDEGPPCAPQRPEGGGDGVRGVGVVDDDERLAVGARPRHALHPARHRPGSTEGGRGRGRVVAGLDEHREGQDGVRDVEVAGQRAADREVGAVRAAEPGGRRPAVDDAADDLPVRGPGVRPGRDGDTGYPCGPGQPPAPGVVDADDAAPGVPRGEQQRLRREVLLHRRVVVEVVLGEVGEPGDVDDEAVDPVLGQGVAGDLHRAGLARRARP